jgi:hypothetical protein
MDIKNGVLAKPLDGIVLRFRVQIGWHEIGNRRVVYIHHGWVCGKSGEVFLV